MVDIPNFAELLRLSDDGPDGWIYYEGDITRLLESAFVVTDGREDIELEQVVYQGDEIPAVLGARGLSRLIDASTFQDIVSCRRESKPGASPREMAEAITYYLENDTFID